MAGLYFKPWWYQAIYRINNKCTHMCTYVRKYVRTYVRTCIASELTNAFSSLSTEFGKLLWKVLFNFSDITQFCQCVVKIMGYIHACMWYSLTWWVCYCTKFPMCDHCSVWVCCNCEWWDGKGRILLCTLL